MNIWFDEFQPTRAKSHDKKADGETARAHAYSLARAVMNTATGAHGPIVGRVNPFAVRGGGSAPKRRRDDHVATGAQLGVILETIRPAWRSLVLLATGTGLRYSEVVALRRSDVDTQEHLVRVRQSVSPSCAEGIGLKGPKSDAGVRDVHIPEHVMSDIRAYLRSYVAGREGLLFYGKPDRARTWCAARSAAGVPTLHFHDLRATGATLMAQLGATEAEIQAFLADSTPA